jgi:hypothetical protein
MPLPPNGSRRSFLKTSATTAAGLTAFAVPAANVLGANDTLQVGCIGTETMIGGKGRNLIIAAWGKQPWWAAGAANCLVGGPRPTTRTGPCWRSSADRTTMMSTWSGSRPSRGKKDADERDGYFLNTGTVYDDLA